MDLYKRKWLAAWLKLTTPKQAQWYSVAPTHHLREQLRRANMISVLAPFCVLFPPLLLFQQVQNHRFLLLSLCCAALAAGCALVFNRRCAHVPAALILICSMDIVIEAAIIQVQILSANWLFALDYFAIPLAASAVLLTRRYVWGFWLLHTLLILGNFYGMPHSSDLTTLIVNGPSITFALPLIVQLGVALLSFLQMGSADEELKSVEEMAKFHEQENAKED
jgi:hypothetical protein